MLVKDLILSLVREKIVKMNYQKSYLFCGFFFLFGLVGPLLEITNKFIMSYKTFHF